MHLPVLEGYKQGDEGLEGRHLEYHNFNPGRVALCLSGPKRSEKAKASIGVVGVVVVVVVVITRVGWKFRPNSMMEGYN